MERFVELLEGDEPFCVATLISPESMEMKMGSKAICLQDGRVEDHGIGGHSEFLRMAADRAIRDGGGSRCVPLPGGAEVFLDVHHPRPRLLVCGAGHIALPLARYAADAGFRLTVLDDRADYAAPARFPDAEAIAGDFIPALRRLADRKYRYVVVITRGHAHDLDCLGEVLHWDTDYIGQIGSQRRLSFIKDELARRGFGAQEVRERLFGPIGLDIGAEGPEEIALAIAAELVCVRRMGAAYARVLRSQNQPCVP